MATLKLTIFKAKVLKDGRHKIRIAICHHKETSYIVTNLVIDNLSQFKNGQVVKRPDAAIMNTKLRNLLNKYQERLDAIENMSSYSITQLKQALLKEPIDISNVTFQQICNEYVDELLQNGQKGYAGLLNSSNTTFTMFTNGDIRLLDITPETIEGFHIYLQKKKWRKATIGIAIRNIRTVINRAIKKRKVVYQIHPFVDFTIPNSPVRDANIELVSLRRMLYSDVKTRQHSVVRDLFALSFYLGGINLVDLLSIDFSGDYVSYRRTKVKNRISDDDITIIPIHNHAKKIINKWINKGTGKLDFGYRFSYKNFARYVSRGVNSLAKSLNIEEHVIFYSARKTFAQFASELGIPDGVIDYCLGHSDKSKGVIRYYTKVKQKQAEIAINRVIDYVDNPEKYKDFLEMRADIMMMKG